jgi:hypothetical protein
MGDRVVLQWSYSVGGTSRKPLRCPHPANSTETDAGFRMAMPSMGDVGVLARTTDPPIYPGYMPRHVFGSAARRIMGYTATWRPFPLNHQFTQFRVSSSLLRLRCVCVCVIEAIDARTQGRSETRHQVRANRRKPRCKVLTCGCGVVF